MQKRTSKFISLISSLRDERKDFWKHAVGIGSHSCLQLDPIAVEMVENFPSEIRLFTRPGIGQSTNHCLSPNIVRTARIPENWAKSTFSREIVGRVSPDHGGTRARDHDNAWGFARSGQRHAEVGGQENSGIGKF